MQKLSIDIETYSDVDIKKAGLYKYARSPAFEVLLMAFSFDGRPPEIIDLTETNGQLPPHLRVALMDHSTIKTAYNAAFEVYCIGRGLFDMSDEEIARWSSQWRCTMLHGQYCGHPAGLEAVGAALGLDADKKKMSIGKSLIRYFCVPCRPTKVNGGRTRNLPEHDPEKWNLFKQYCLQDVVTEMAVDTALQQWPVPDEVQKQWLLDQAINIRGVQVDTELVRGAIALDAQNGAVLIEEAERITGLDNPNSGVQLREWLWKELGEEVPSLAKANVEELLARVPDGAAKRVLQIRQALGKTSNKKYAALATAVCDDGRIRGMMAFYGANRTGREAGRIFQPQNLPHDTVPMEPVGRELIKAENYAGLELVYGSVPHTLSALIRTALVAKKGCLYVDADFSAIEARVVAWLSGEEWVLDVFRTHGKIYEATASQMFGVPFDSIKKGNPEYAYRAKGKVATLALGYQGGPGALINMGALRSGLTEEELPEIVERWRVANRHTVDLWYRVEEAARTVIIRGGEAVVKLSEGVLVFRREENHQRSFMTIQLPSRRKLFYASPFMTTNRFGSPSIGYMGQNGTSGKWEKTETYGGKLVENITQAVARDCLFFAMENLTKAGYKIVFDIHDEVVIEAPEKSADLDDVVRIMSISPPWARSLPLNADGWVGPYFRKD